MTMEAHTRALRRRSDLIRDDRMVGGDMRTRSGRRFSTIMAAVKNEFGDGVDPIRAAVICRLRMISEKAQADCLAGRIGLDRLVRISNLLLRAEKQATAVGKARPEVSGANALSTYLAQLNDRPDEDETEPEVETAPEVEQ